MDEESAYTAMDHYNDGYVDGVRTLNDTVGKIMMEATSPEEFLVGVTKLIIGNTVVLNGGSADDAMTVAGLVDLI